MPRTPASAGAKAYGKKGLDAYVQECNLNDKHNGNEIEGVRAIKMGIVR